MNADCECHFGNLAQVVVEEARVSPDGVVVERLDSGSAFHAGSGLIEGNVAVWANSSEEQLDAATPRNLLLVLDAFSLEIGRVAVEQVHVLRLHIHMREKVAVHESVVRFWVFTWDTDILVHVEGGDILEGDTSIFVGLDEVLVDDYWAAASG